MVKFGGDLKPLEEHRLPPESLPPKTGISHTAQKSTAIRVLHYRQKNTIIIVITAYRRIHTAQLSIPPKKDRPESTANCCGHRPKHTGDTGYRPKGTACTEYDHVFFYKVTSNVCLSVFICILCSFGFAGSFFLYSSGYGLRENVQEKVRV